MELHDLLARCLVMIIAVVQIARISSCLGTEVLNEVSDLAAEQAQDVQLFLNACILGDSNILIYRKL